MYKFLAMWDCNGLECLFDITDLEHDAMISGLKDETFKMPFNLNTMMLRARFNSQRSYEIYIFETEDLGYDQIKELFDESPQFIVNAVRKSGRKLYSDYSQKEKVIS
jgi:hypothetical protein